MVRGMVFYVVVCLTVVGAVAFLVFFFALSGGGKR